MNAGNDISELKDLSDAQSDGPKGSTQNAVSRSRPNPNRAQPEFNGRTDGAGDGAHFAFVRLTRNSISLSLSLCGVAVNRSRPKATTLLDTVRYDVEISALGRHAASDNPQGF